MVAAGRFSSGRERRQRCSSSAAMAAKILVAICAMHGTQGFVLPHFCPASTRPLRTPCVNRAPGERALAGAAPRSRLCEGNGRFRKAGACLVAMSEDAVGLWRGERRGVLAGGALAAALLGGFPMQAVAKDEILQRLEGDIVPQLPAGMDFANLSLTPALPSRETLLCLHPAKASKRQHLCPLPTCCIITQRFPAPAQIGRRSNVMVLTRKFTPRNPRQISAVTRTSHIPSGFKVRSTECLGKLTVS